MNDVTDKFNAYMMNSPQHIISFEGTKAPNVDLHYYVHDIQGSTAQPAIPRYYIQNVSDSTASQLEDESVLISDIEVASRARDIINEALGQLQSDEELAVFEQKVVDFIGEFGSVATRALDAILLRSNYAEIEPLARGFLRALGDHEAAVKDQSVFKILRAQLSGPRPGRRSAAASSLGGYHSSSALTILKHRLAVEQNKVVRATLQAYIRVMERNGVSPQKIVR